MQLLTYETAFEYMVNPTLTPTPTPRVRVRVRVRVSGEGGREDRDALPISYDKRGT